MPIRTPDPMDDLKDRKREIDTARPSKAATDPQELAEREEAAVRYAGENEAHFVAYCEDCVATSVRATAPQRQIWDLCWRVFNEEEPASYANKAAWQSRILVSKPFPSVMYGAASVKKAFTPDFLSIQDEQNKPAADFWKRQMDAEFMPGRANFVGRYVDALTMALAVGVSMEVIPQYLPGRGLFFDLGEPWKFHRDPDGPPNDPQGGMYWIHEEWLDYWVLRQGEKKKRYQNVARAVAVDASADGNDPFMTREAIARRKRQIYERGKYRKMVQTREFWGTVLSPGGELLLENGTYTVAGGRVIAPPRTVRYQTLRWPGVHFSPLPNILSSGGRGLLQGVTRIWESMNNLMALFEDALKWVVNPPKEINVDALKDPNDVESCPGKDYLVHETVNGQQAIRVTQQRDPSSSAMGAGQFFSQMFDEGSMVSSAVQGLPGYRAEVTARESAQQLSQSQSVYSLMGHHLEQGAIRIAAAAKDVVETYASYADLKRYHTDEQLAAWGIFFDGGNPTTSRNELPRLSGQFSISGIQALMKDAEVLDWLTKVAIPLANTPRFAPYIRPRKVLASFEKRSGLKDEDLFLIDEEHGAAIEQAEQAEYETGKHIQNQSREMTLNAQQADLLQRLQAAGAGPAQGEPV